MSMDITKLTEEKESATEKWKEYREACKTSRDPLYKELKKVYAAIKNGKQVIDVFKAIQTAGIHQNYHPKLAIAKASSKTVFLKYERNGTVKFKNESWKVRVADVYFDQWLPSWNSGPWVLELQAPVPIIPPRLRPAKMGEDYYILWEVDAWKPVPSKDPYLLRRLTKNLFVICAAWDLTDVEMAVMAGRIQA